MKKLISVLLTVALVLTMGAPVYAAQNGDGTETSEPREALFRYMFKLFSREETEALSDKIAQEAKYKIIVVYDDIQTVMVCVKISDNPQISNAIVLSKSVRKIYKHTEELTADLDGTVVLLTPNRLAGELALHMYACMYMLMFEWTGRWENFDARYHQFDVAELDLDEERLPEGLMNFVGFMLHIFGSLG